MARAPKKPADDTDDRPLWRVNEKSFIGHSLVEEGTENYPYEPEDGGHISENLSPMNDAAQAIVDAQAEPHPDKSDGKKPRTPKAGADAAAADVGGEDDGDLS